MLRLSHVRVLAHEQALEYFGDISQIKGVMEFGGDRRFFCQDSLIDFNGAYHHHFIKLLDWISKVAIL